MPSMIRRLTSVAEARGAGRLVHLDQVAAALGAHPVADAVVAGEVGGGLGRGDHVVGGDAVLGVRQRRPRRSRRRAPRSAPASPRRPRARPASIASSASSAGTPKRRPFRSSRPGASTPPSIPTEVESQGSRPCMRAEQQRRVGDVAGQRPALVERGGEGDHPVARDRAVGRLQADDPAERRRLADRAAGVGADRAGREAAGDDRGRAAGGAARDPLAVPGVEHRPVGRVLVRGAHRELVHVGLAEHPARRPRVSRRTAVAV